MDFIECISLIFSIVYSLLESVLNFVIPIAWRSKDISSDVVLITGASSGLGRQLSYDFAKKGCALVLWDVNEPGLAETASECEKLGAVVKYYKCDLSKSEDIYNTADIVKKEVGDIDILVNNAGIVSGKKLADTPDKMIELTMNVNIMAHFWCLKAFLPKMLEKNHGHIVTVASMAGKLGSPGLIDYTASKFAAVGLDSALRSELYKLKKTGVHTTCVCPAYIATGMFAGIENSAFTSIFVPILTPEYVCYKIMQAVLTNQYLLILPRISNFLIIVDSLIPTKTMLLLGKLCGAMDAMDSFKGREKAE